MSGMGSRESGVGSKKWSGSPLAISHQPSAISQAVGDNSIRETSRICYRPTFIASSPPTSQKAPDVLTIHRPA